MSRLSRRAILIFLASAAVGVCRLADAATPTAGASADKAAPASKPAAKFEPSVRIHLSPSLVNAALIVAVRKQFFEDEGLKLDAQIALAPPSLAIQLISGGKIDFSATNPSSGTNNAILRGSSMVALSSAASIPRDRPVSGLMISEKLWSEGVRTIKEFKGRTLNIFPSLDSTSGRVVSLLMQRAGMDFRRDIRVQEWSDNQLLTQAFLGGAVDNFYATEPIATVARIQGKARFLASSTDVIAGGVALLMWGNSDFVKANPETTVRVLKGHLRGVKYFNDAFKSKWTKNADVLEILEKETKVKTDMLKQVGWSDYAEDGLIDIEDLQATMRYFKELGTTKDIIPLERWIDQSYVKEAVKRLKGEGKL